MNTQPINPDLILGRLQAGTLIRKEWGDGRKRACLLVALAPECAEKESFEACPANVMPLWLAHLTPAMDDGGTASAWEPFVRRYAAVAARWYRLDEAAWHRAFLGSLIAILEIARDHDPSGSCDRVIALCREGASAEDPRWEATAKAANADVWEAAAKAAMAAEAAKAAMWAAMAAMAAMAATAAARAAVWAAARASMATEWTAKAAKAAIAAAGAAVGAVTMAVTRAADADAVDMEKAWDQVTDGILAAIEAECDEVEKV